MTPIEAPHDDRPARYVEDGRVVYRASSLGACERMLVATAHPDTYPPAPWPADFQSLLDQGTELEPVISAMWDERTGIPTTGQQMTVELDIGELANGPVVVRAHIDGQRGVAPVGREYKKFRESTWVDFLKRGVEVIAHYPWQVAAMMWATGWEWEFVGGHCVADPIDGTAWTITEVHGITLTEPPIPYRAIFQKLSRVEQMIAQGFDPKEVPCVVQYPCPQWKIHDPADEAYEIPVSGEMAEVARAAIAEIHEANIRLKQHNAAVEVVEKRKKEAAGRLRAALEAFGPAAMGAKKLVTEEFEISHVVKVIPAHMRSESNQDYFQVKAAKGAVQQSNQPELPIEEEGA